MTRRPLSFARLQYYANRTKGSKPTTVPVRRTVRYVAYGSEQEQQETLRGRWYGPDGPTTHEEVQGWAGAGARSHRYTYQAVLSARDGTLSPEAFCQAWEAGRLPQSWRLIRHADSDHDHAHVLFFSHRRLSRRQVKGWNEAVRREIEALVREQAREAAQEAVRQQEMTQTAAGAQEQEVAHGQGAALEL